MQCRKPRILPGVVQKIYGCKELGVVKTLVMNELPIMVNSYINTSANYFLGRKRRPKTSKYNSPNRNKFIIQITVRLKKKVET